MGRDLKVEFGRINQDNIEQVSTPTDVLYAELSCEEQTMGFLSSPSAVPEPYTFSLIAHSFNDYYLSH